MEPVTFMWWLSVFLVYCIRVFHSLLAVKFGRAKKAEIIFSLMMHGGMLITLLLPPVEEGRAAWLYTPIALVAGMWVLNVLFLFSRKYQQMVLSRISFRESWFKRIDRFFMVASWTVTAVLLVGFIYSLPPEVSG